MHLPTRFYGIYTEETINYIVQVMMERQGVVVCDICAAIKVQELLAFLPHL